ncbi:MAG: hypothetical protein R3B48_09560 [Kofleriaceae bacterium]
MISKLQLAAVALLGAGIASALAAPALQAPQADDHTAAGARAFAQVARVLLSPRCRNCHPAGDAPLQGDDGHRHAMNITRASPEAGLACSTCHQEQNSEAVGVAGGPPGAPHWGLPSRDTPMIFQGRSVPALCAQLKDPAQTGGRDLEALLEHVTNDPLVRWGWSPGGHRSSPPLSHAQFVEAFRVWVESGGACP